MARIPTTAGKKIKDGGADDDFRKAAANTLASIHEAVSTADLTFFSNRSATEVEALKEEVAAVIPAGNVVGLVLSGLVRLRGRSLPDDQAKTDVSALLRAVEMLPRNILPKIHYGTFFAGPAAVLSAYQKLLALAGKEIDQAFPDGLWQFYLEFAMREDGARHTNEAAGFQNALAKYGLTVSPIDQLAAWVCAVSRVYFQYDDLLFNEWRERVYLSLLKKIVAEANLGHKLQFQRLPEAWAAQRPYHRGHDASHNESFPLYRRRRFDNFLQSRLDLLPDDKKKQLDETFAQRLEQELAAYQQQMTILTTLDPERYRENRIPIPLWQARIAIILDGCHYHLLPACYTNHQGLPLLFESQEPNAPAQPLQADAEGKLFDQMGRMLSVNRRGQVYDAGTNQIVGYLQPAHFQAVRRQIAAIIQHHAVGEAGTDCAALDDQLLAIERAEQSRARRDIQSEEIRESLRALRCAPVIINWAEQDGSKPLAYIRRGKRGIGDHALTMFRTDCSMVFDQSHIYFDGTWGMALSEILTEEAVSWAAYFHSLPAPDPDDQVPYHLRLPAQPALAKFPQKIAYEVTAEDSGVNMKSLYKLCRLLPKRHPDLKLTVNDLLILYRSEFGHEYRPSPTVEDQLFEFRAQGHPDNQEVYHLINDLLVKSQISNPALMIPMDATATSPRERLYPTTIRNPFPDLWSNYKAASKALDLYDESQTQVNWAVFTEARRSLLIQLNYFGQLLRAYKKVALEGGSTSTATMKLLAHLPPYLMKLLDEIPRRVEILNEVLKGEEVFSNVGRVARGSSLLRFISAKDDNESKNLVWGILTDDNDVMHLTLCDFRPHTIALHKLNRSDLAELIVKDYLGAYVTGFNQFVVRLLDILQAKATHSPEKVAE